MIYAVAFAAGLIATEGAYWAVFRGRDARKAINRRLALSENNTTRGEVLKLLERERGLVDRNNPLLARLGDLLTQTGLRLNQTTLVLWTLAIGAALFGVADALLADIRVPAAIGLLGGPAAVIVFLKFVRSRRIRRFAVQLPDAINVIVRGLKVGHPFSTAVELVSREMADPIGTEFGITADEIAFGHDVTLALNNLYRRVGQEDLLFVVIAVSVQTQTGGNLAEVLDRLAKLVREREKLRLKVKALSAEGRLSAVFLTAMPFLLCAAIQLLSPTYFTDFLVSKALMPTLTYAGVSLLVSNLAIYKMVNVKV